MNTKMLPRKTTKSIDDRTTRWEGPYPQTITFAECYISSIDFLESYYALELYTKFEKKWMHLFVYLQFDELKEILKRSTNHEFRKLDEEEEFQEGNCSEFISISDALGTYIYCKGIDLKGRHVVFDSEDNANVYALGDFRGYPEFVTVV